MNLSARILRQQVNHDIVKSSVPTFIKNNIVNHIHNFTYRNLHSAFLTQLTLRCFAECFPQLNYAARYTPKSRAGWMGASYQKHLALSKNNRMYRRDWPTWILTTDGLSSDASLRFHILIRCRHISPADIGSTWLPNSSTFPAAGIHAQPL